METASPVIAAVGSGEALSVRDQLHIGTVTTGLLGTGADEHCPVFRPGPDEALSGQSDAEPISSRAGWEDHLGREGGVRARGRSTPGQQKRQPLPGGMLEESLRLSRHLVVHRVDELVPIAAHDDRGRQTLRSRPSVQMVENRVEPPPGVHSAGDLGPSQRLCDTSQSHDPVSLSGTGCHSPQDRCDDGRVGAGDDGGPIAGRGVRPFALNLMTGDVDNPGHCWATVVR
ncbi:hypothetical protein [Brevibacterium sp.]|uniref:hypothetical protein n=1 Tax=Brevibacterium sp. TaxID=1701 RepID=UPI00264701DF|nr:hypothetical protein [Brevibacterium sp.]MDN6604454.1 hypothetical protein [Brevibacterium sp.]